MSICPCTRQEGSGAASLLEGVEEVWCRYVCPLVLSCQLARKGLSAKYEPLNKTARYWVGQSKQEYTWGKRTSKRLSLPLDRGHERRIRKVPQEDGHSSVYRAILFDCPYERILPWIFPMCYLHATMIILYPWIKYNTDGCLFSQVKNKPWPPEVYSWIRHRCEQFLCLFIIIFIIFLSV